jgi:NADP-dependent 3-hydroxy acid dehydrogenase YdfG
VSAAVLLVVGAGPGVGAAVARRFGSEGYDAALIARGEDRLVSLAATLEKLGITATWAAVDITAPAQLTEAITAIGRRAGRIDVLHFNPSVCREKDPLALSVPELLEDVHLGVASLLTAVQAARLFMPSGGRILATGGMAADRPWHLAASLGVQKAALRNLVRSLDATLAPEGIRAASLTVAGTLGESPAFSPERIADALFEVARTDDDRWEPEVAYRG